MTAAVPDLWHIDVRIQGRWRAAVYSERTLAAARNRADCVYHWATVRVTNPVSRERWIREPGHGWAPAEPEQLTPPPANPRSPMRAPENATAEQPNYWWREKDLG